MALDLKDGPIVVESAPNTLGIVNEGQLDSGRSPEKAGTVVRADLAAGADRAYGMNVVYKIR